MVKGYLLGRDKDMSPFLQYLSIVVIYGFMSKSSYSSCKLLTIWYEMHMHSDCRAAGHSYIGKMLKGKRVFRHEKKGR